MLHRRFIALLQLQGIADSNIRNICRLRLLDIPSDTELAETRQLSSEGRPARVQSNSQATVAWLLSHDLLDGFLNSVDFREADKTIQPARDIRRLVQALLVANISYAEIVAIAAAKLGKRLTENGIRLFERYFFDWKYADTDALRRLFSSFPDGPNLRAVFMTGKSEIALWKLGFAVEVRPEDALSYIANEAFMRFVETRASPNSMQTAMAASKWFEIMAAANEKLSASTNGGKLGEILELLRKVEMETIPQAAPSIEDLRK